MSDTLSIDLIDKKVSDASSVDLVDESDRSCLSCTFNCMVHQLLLIKIIVESFPL